MANVEDGPANVPPQTAHDPTVIRPVVIGGMSVREAAAALGCSCQAIYLLNKLGKVTLLTDERGKKIVPLDVLATLRARWKR